MVSAKPATMKTKNERSAEPRTTRPGLLRPDDLAERGVPGEDQDGHQAHPHGDFVGDHLGAGPEPASRLYLLFEDQPASAIP